MSTLSTTLAAFLMFGMVAPSAPSGTGASASSAPQLAPAVERPAPPASLPAGSVVYRTLQGREAQVTFTSPAPLERIVGKSNAVAGYVLPGPAEQPAKLAGGEWILPVRSLATGLPLRDEHLAAPEWLDAAAYPEIQFTLARVEAIKEIKRGDDFSTWSATLVGTMTLHGVSREVQVADARLSFLKESEKTRAIAPGDLLFLKCDYTIRLSEFGIKHADVPKKVADVVELSQMLRMSSATPEAIKAARESSTGGGTPAAPDAATNPSPK